MKNNLKSPHLCIRFPTDHNNLLTTVLCTPKKNIQCYYHMQSNPTRRPSQNQIIYSASPPKSNRFLGHMLPTHTHASSQPISRTKEPTTRYRLLTLMTPKQRHELTVIEVVQTVLVQAALVSVSPQFILLAGGEDVLADLKLLKKRMHFRY